MANITIKDFKFPRNGNTYFIPQVDNTLSIEGASADAKKTGDEISELKEDLNDISESVVVSDNFLPPVEEVGGYNTSTGAKDNASNNTVRTPNAVKIPDGVSVIYIRANTTFTNYLSVLQYATEDTDSFIKQSSYANTDRATITLDSNTRYIRLFIGNKYSISDFSVNTSDVAYNEYEEQRYITKTALPSIIDENTITSLAIGDYIAVENEIDGTGKFDLGKKLIDINNTINDFSEFEILSNNILNPQGETGYYSATDGTKKNDSSYVRTVNATKLPTGTTQITLIAKNQFTGTVGVFFYTTENTDSFNSRVGVSNLTLYTVNVPTGCEYVRISMPNSNSLADLSIASDAITVFDTYNTGNIIKNNSLPISVSTLSSMVKAQWELGTISSLNGKNEDSTTRVRNTGYIPINEFYAYENDLNLKTILFAYSDKRYTSFLGRMWEGFTYNYYTKEEVLEKYPTAKYVRLLFASSDTTEVSSHTNIFGSESYYQLLSSYNEINPTGYSYDGERIVLNNRCRFSRLDYGGMGQDCVQQGIYFFACGINGTISVKNVNDGSLIKTVYLDQYSTIKPHCNSAVWGNKYSESDVFPLLYINAYNADGLPKGTCYVHRITDTNGVPNTPTELIQTITVEFTNEEPWTAGGDARPYGNFFVDTINGDLWAYTLRDTPNKVMRFFKFDLPSVSESAVTLAISDIKDQFDIPFWSYMQGNTYQDGKAYILSGFGTESQNGILSVVNLTSKSIVSQINFNNLGFTIEPEFVNIVDDCLIMGESIAYKFKF